MQYPNLFSMEMSNLKLMMKENLIIFVLMGNLFLHEMGLMLKGIVMVDPETGNMKSIALQMYQHLLTGLFHLKRLVCKTAILVTIFMDFGISQFGKTDVKLPSDEGTEANVSPIFDENGDMYYFTDFTSPKEGVDSMLGYALTDSRTGKATYYTGNLEESYMDSQGALQIIEKKFIEKKWEW